MGTALRKVPDQLCAQEEGFMKDHEIENLVKKAKRREPAAFTELMQFYLNDMYRVALAILANDEDAADAIQDSILVCWEKIDTLQHIRYFKTWMTKILIHKCYRIRKSREKLGAMEEYEEPAVYDKYNLELKEALSILDAGRPVPLVNGNTSQSYVLGGDDVTGQIDYCISVPLSSEGEHIEKVTYSINKGAFQIVQAEGKSIIVSGEEYAEDDRINNMNCGSIGGNYSEETGLPENPVETKFYKSFTVDYQKQSDDQTWINIVDNVPDSQEAIDLIWGQDSLQAMQSGLQKILDNTTITCTVEYTDHTSQSVDIKVGSRVMTYREAGEPEASVKGDPDEETVYITFELQ